VFVKEIENAVLSGDVDVAVHSLKDMPSAMTPGLILPAFTTREDPRDVLVTRHRCTLAELPKGAKVGTSSPRRAAQVKALRPDVQIVELRGNVDTRLRKAAEEDYDGIILAAAGLIRMGWETEISEYLDPEVCLPAVGQGAMAVQVRSDDADTIETIATVDDSKTRAEVVAERAFLSALGGGCQVPFGALGKADDGALELEGMIAAPDGSRVIRASVDGRSDEAESLGKALAEKMMGMGAGEILDAEDS
jgi:hydroxymethylbilane synthase